MPTLRSSDEAHSEGRKEAIDQSLESTFQGARRRDWMVGVMWPGGEEP